jgi:HPt (histidine-containing phosphotransfer) domain-containing protein
MQAQAGSNTADAGKMVTWVERRREAFAPWPIDLVHLRRFTMGDRQLEREVLGLFACDLPANFQTLTQATSAQDWRLAAHTIKGTARTVGAWRLARAAYAAERCAWTAQDAERRNAACAAVGSAVEEVVAHIRRITSVE